MEEKILEAAVTSFINVMIDEVKSVFSGLLSQGKQFFEKDIKSYLINQQKRYSHIKTLLRGNNPVFIYDIYYNLNIIDINGKEKRREIRRRVGNVKAKYTDNQIDTSDIKNIFKNSNNITIIGDAGSGKSTLIKHLFLNSITTKYSIPILIELRYLNSNESALYDYIYDKILESKLSQNGDILEKLLESGKFVFFLDGYDELKSTRKNKISEEINSFPIKYPKNKYILTTRPYSDIEHLELFHNYEIMGLSDINQINSFIDLQLKDEQELAEKIKTSLNSNKSRYIDSFLRNPLLLSLYILTFQSNASIPDKKYIFYRRVINALFSEHDSKTKLGFVRERLSGINQEELEKLLRAFCFISFFENKFSFDYDYVDINFNKIKEKLKIEKYENFKIISDLKSAISLWVDDNGIYSFAHRSLQEYFAASFIKNLTESEKIRMYDKIISKFADDRLSFNEIENFLSLLEEIDQLYFLKYYKLPLLKDLLNIVSIENERDMVRSFVTFLCKGISGIDKDNKRIASLVEVNKDVYKTIYIHLPYTRELHLRICEIFRKDKMINEEIYTCDTSFKEGIPKKMLEKIYTEDIIKITVKFKSFIEESIKNAEIYIKNAIENDKDFVDMI